MDYLYLRKSALKVFIAFLVLTAVIAIITIFVNEYSQLQVRILLTALTISICSVCVMSSAAISEKHSYNKAGFTGIFTAVTALVLLLFVIWGFDQNELFLKITGSVSVAALAFALMFLLLLPVLLKKHQWWQMLTAYTICFLAAMIIITVWTQIREPLYFQFLTAISIVAGLGTLTIPILLKMKGQLAGETIDQPEFSLHLTHLTGDIYKTPTGETYKVERFTDLST